MDRLTVRDPKATTKENGVCCTHFQSEECKTWQGHCEQCSVNEAVWERLAQYEDTGFEPEAVQALRSIAEEKRLMVMPNPVGGPVYCVHQQPDGAYIIVPSQKSIPLIFITNEQGEGKAFSLDKCFPTPEAAAEAIRRLEQQGQEAPDNIVPLRPRQEGEHGSGKA